MQVRVLLGEPTKYWMKQTFNQFILEKYTFSDKMSNLDIVKDVALTDKLLSLTHTALAGGMKAILRYPTENISSVVIAYDADIPVGWVTTTGGNTNIFVDPQYRGRGIAKELSKRIH